MTPIERPWRAAEFFAGIGLVRLALERAGIDVIWSNDIEPQKVSLYAANFGLDGVTLGDIRRVAGVDLPPVDLATASFPCTDLSLAGNRAGLSGEHSSMFWEFARVLHEMGSTRPPVVMLENVPGFATSRGGSDLRAAMVELNRLGYICDLFVLNAQNFVPQSRERMFIVGCSTALTEHSDWTPSALRPVWVQNFIARNPDINAQALPLQLPFKQQVHDLSTVVEQLPTSSKLWWDGRRVAAFVQSLSTLQSARLDGLKCQDTTSWRTAYRRTRHGSAVWEIRPDGISGCLRTARGGSSKQAIVQTGRGVVKVRWMTAREYARLQGAPSYKLGAVSERQALFGFGDAVCVPVIEWIAERYLAPAVAASVRFAHAR